MLSIFLHQCIYTTEGVAPFTGGQQRGRGIALAIHVGAEHYSGHVAWIKASAAQPSQVVAQRSNGALIFGDIQSLTRDGPE